VAPSLAAATMAGPVEEGGERTFAAPRAKGHLDFWAVPFEDSGFGGLKGA